MAYLDILCHAKEQVRAVGVMFVPILGIPPSRWDIGSASRCPHLGGDQPWPHFPATRHLKKAKEG
jgi:hypothetical protein